MIRRTQGVTDGVAHSLQLDLGSTLALDGRRRTVVGIVEDPSRLSDEFALVSPLVRPGDRDPLTLAARELVRVPIRVRGDGELAPRLALRDLAR